MFHGNERHPHRPTLPQHDDVSWYKEAKRHRPLSNYIPWIRPTTPPKYPKNTTLYKVFVFLKYQGRNGVNEITKFSQSCMVCKFMCVTWPCICMFSNWHATPRRQGKSILHWQTEPKLSNPGSSLCVLNTNPRDDMGKPNRHWQTEPKSSTPASILFVKCRVWTIFSRSSNAPCILFTLVLFVATPTTLQAEVISDTLMILMVLITINLGTSTVRLGPLSLRRLLATKTIREPMGYCQTFAESPFHSIVWDIMFFARQSS